MDYINDREKLLFILRENLSDEKYEHSIKTEERAKKLARIFGADENKAGFAGLIHDITKCMDNAALAKKYGIEKYASKKTLHQTTGARYIEEHGITGDRDIIDAVASHTTGTSGMTTLQKIIYLADATEPDRKFSGAEKLRQLSERNLDEAMLFSLSSTIAVLKNKNLPIDENTKVSYNEIKEKLAGREAKMNISEKAKKIAGILDSKKGRDIMIIYVADKTIVSDYFVIASAASTTLVKTLAEELEDKSAAAGFPPQRIEGVREGRWAVLDFSDVLVHIFHDEEREFYQLERLWADEENSVLYSELQ